MEQEFCTVLYFLFPDEFFFLYVDAALTALLSGGIGH